MKAILFSHELDHLSIILNGDSEVEINAFKSENESLAFFDHFLASVQSTINAFYNISFLLPIMTNFFNKILMFSSIKKILLIFNICGAIDGSEIHVHSYYLYQTSNNNNNNE